MSEIKVEMVILSFHVLQEEMVVSILFNNEISVTGNEVSSNSVVGQPASWEGRRQCGNLKCTVTWTGPNDRDIYPNS